MPSTATPVAIPVPPLADDRRHDLDALRALAMLLGIVLHAALAYGILPWVVQDRQQHLWYNGLVSAIHLFRMPLFFMLSGFFTAMLWRKRGVVGLLVHRGRRIGLPLALGLVTIIPLMWGAIYLAMQPDFGLQAGASSKSAEISVSGEQGSASTIAAEIADDPTITDHWTAAARGNVAALNRLIRAGGADLDAQDGMFGVTPLGWTAVKGHPEATRALLEAGADPDVIYRDGHVPLHTAAFFGRADVAALLIEHDADVNARNLTGETPLDAIRHDENITRFIAGALQVPFVWDEVVQGRGVVGELLRSKGAVSGLGVPLDAPLPTPTEDERTGEPLALPIAPAASSSFADTLLKWFAADPGEFPFFHHLWFLWFLLWFVGIFAALAAPLGAIWPGTVRLPGALVSVPGCLVWLVPLTMLTQSMMTAGGMGPAFGPDTAVGLFPLPRILAHYAVFYFFGCLLYLTVGSQQRLGRKWFLLLPLAIIVTFPAAFMFTFGTEGGRSLIADDETRRYAALAMQALTVWFMIFGSIGLCEHILSRERRSVRYLSDASYWLYLTHLPIIIAGQAWLRHADFPAFLKFSSLVVAPTAVLLLVYAVAVRHTWLGRLLNGPRERSRPIASPAADPDLARATAPAGGPAYERDPARDHG